ncbi:hypothetical protein BS47DRAFT_96911 [Hydnum rufescens UP504]|uniref:Uncharacterized protein n=1 Tax=Hydnum rufescens UP504 TaxID=1448309 RepID=A0A9P6ASP5_9AGAM|nr:hypothetical protein BS47DRAFT_96911 [Hydnum rufescens UP504]
MHKARGEIRARSRPRPEPSTIRKVYDNTLNTVPHTRFGGCVAILWFRPPRNPSEECTDKTQAKYGRTRSHARPQRPTIRNQYNDASNTVPHPPKRVCGNIRGVFLLCCVRRRLLPSRVVAFFALGLHL